MALQRFPKFFYTEKEATEFGKQLVGEGGYEVRKISHPPIEVPGPSGAGAWQKVAEYAVFYGSSR